MKTGRPAAPIELSDEEYIELLRRSRQRKGSAESRIRAEIILACAGGESGTSIAHRLGIGVHMAVALASAIQSAATRWFE